MMLSRLSTWSIGTQIIVAMLSVGGTVIGFGGFLLSEVVHEKQSDRLQIEVNKRTELFSVTLIDALLTDDLAILETSVQGLSEMYSSLDGVTICNYKNQPLLEWGSQSDCLEKNTREIDDDLLILATYQDIIFEEERFGAVSLRWDISHQRAALNAEIYLLVLSIAAAVLLLVFLLMGLVRVMVIQPIHKVDDLLRRVHSEKLFLLTEAYGSLELSRLGEGVKALSFSISKQQMLRDEQQELLRTLEEKVEERTRDLTLEVEERKQAEQRALAADTAKSEFLANMSHEIRTPMNGVIGLCYLALQRELSPDLKDLLEKIQLSANSLLDIINDILDFSKIEAGKLEMEEVEFELSDVLDQLSSLTVFRASEKGVEVLFDIDAAVPNALLGDPTRLRQILINLTNNAIKFTEQGQVVVRSLLKKEQNGLLEIEFSVHDSGIGMSEEQLGQLFKSFSQADSSTTRKYGGTGLGLAISKQLVEMMGGEIGVKSELGVGSTFYFTISLHKGSGSIAPRGLDRKSLNGMRILIVDDNELSAEIIKRSLDQNTFLADVAFSGEQALEMLKRAQSEEVPYQVVLMDWKMPGMDGIETTCALQSDPQMTSLPVVIMVSAYDRVDAESRLSGGELAGWLSKPATPSQLLNGIVGALSHQSIDMRTIEQELDDSVLQGLSVLLVEDNKINQQVAESILSGMGVTVTVAENGVEAVEIVTGQHHFDLVLMDVQMPLMDGYEATRQIRKHFFLDQLPVIAMTANAMQGDREKVLEAGMNDYLSKPIDIDALLRMLQRWSKKSISRQEDAADTVEEKIDWPEQLPGIKVAEGVRRMMGDPSLYLDILEDFVEEGGAILELLNRDSELDTVDQIRGEVHSLKGAAANVSANGLAEQLEGVEKVLKKQSVIPSEQLQLLNQKMEQVRSSFNRLKKQSEGK